MKKHIELYDIYDYYYTPFTQTSTFKILITLVVIAFASMIYFLILRRKKKPLTPWEHAYQKIDNLLLEKCSTKKDFKRFYFALTDIIKRYLNKRYNWNTLEKTDNELINYLQKQKFKPALIESLKKMLDGAVWIKFAGEETIKTQARKDLKIAKNIIKQTQPTNNKQITSK